MQKTMLAGVVGLILGSTAVWADSMPPRIAEGDSASMEKAVAQLALGFGSISHTISLPTVDREFLQAHQAKRAADYAEEGSTKPLQLGFARDIPASSQWIGGHQLKWMRLEDGSHAAQIALHSPEAKALRVAMNVEAPKGVTLSFAGSKRQNEVFVELAKHFDGSDVTWSPIVEGEVLVAEIRVPKNVSTRHVAIYVDQVSHFDMFLQDVAAFSKASGYCEKDVACKTNPPAGWTTAKNAVAKMVFTQGGGSYLCTGTLLNSKPTPVQPYFYTANHCISTQTVANTLQTYWFYEASTCGGALGNYKTLTGGATMLYTNRTRDVAFMKLKSAPPAGATYAAWNSGSVASNANITGIHHPAGDKKKYSEGYKLSNSNYGSYGPFHRVKWTLGVTEGGSSGSGVFTYNSAGYFEHRGGLYGGPSACGGATLEDYYSQLEGVYSSLKQYLNP